MTETALNPYPSYRDSGLPWLGTIPEHWALRRAKYLYREVDDRSRSGTEELLSVSHLTGVTPRREKNVTMFMAESNVGHKICQPKDLVINTMWAWMAALGVAAQEGLVSPSYGVYRPLSNDLLPGYADRLLRTPMYAAEYTRRSTGVNSSRLRLYPDQFLRIPIIVPPESEQRSIVHFINRINLLTSRYIRSKRKLMHLLQEQQQAVVHNAITKATNPRNNIARTQDWPYAVPGHWQFLALKWVLNKLIDCEHKTAPAVDQSDFRVVRTAAIRNGHLNLKGTYCTTESAFKEWTRRGTPEPGDVMFTREAPAGEACIVPAGMKLCLGQRTVLMKVNRALYDPEFLIHMIYAGPPHLRIRIASQGSTVGHFNMDDIGSMYVLAPPVEEQRRLVATIEAETKDLALAVEAAEREIQLLREYRIRLVTDVVTGRLDVREAVSNLLDESDEPDEMSLVDDILEEGDEADLGMDNMAEEVAE